MHVVLGILTSIVSVLYLLDRMGVDLGGLNPWSWRRRRNWRNQFQGDPIYAIDDPMEVASLLVVGAAKLDGDLTVEQKSSLLNQFESRFSLSQRKASELLAASSHLLGGPQLIDSQLKGLIKRHGGTLTDEQVGSLVEMIKEVAAVGGASTESQSEYLIDVQSALSQRSNSRGEWG